MYIYSYVFTKSVGHIYIHVYITTIVYNHARCMCTYIGYKPEQLLVLFGMGCVSGLLQDEAEVEGRRFNTFLLLLVYSVQVADHFCCSTEVYKYEKCHLRKRDSECGANF